MRNSVLVLAALLSRKTIISYHPLYLSRVLVRSKSMSSNKQLPELPSKRKGTKRVSTDKAADVKRSKHDKEEILSDGKHRCSWVGNDSLMMEYHDSEWGVPSRDDRHLFEMLILEGAQAGLNWRTVLAKRENYRQAYDNFDVHKIAVYDNKKVEELLSNSGIIRNKLKVNASILNAKATIDIQKEFGSLSNYLWRFVDDKPIIRVNDFSLLTKSEVSDAISADLKKRGMKFVGTTIIYAFMQAVGMVNDHDELCFCRKKE